ncbi:DeoR family transcriptional regulator [Escherichia coli]
MVAEKGIVSIAKLTDRMNVSHMTIRQEFKNWSSREPLCWSAGGVRLRDASRMNLSSVKTALAMTQKAAIGKLAASLLSREVVSIWIGRRPR